MLGSRGSFDTGIETDYTGEYAPTATGTKNSFGTGVEINCIGDHAPTVLDARRKRPSG